ncbi:hypothetical protein K493DRAFT_305276 [Basidiobolus meristosporus CBS 931.73]|uniref:Uncharacterized protein n=1 Tax=Basidiobolus meristosporus CBS 931.73 TaxID=1314790 RepID=A0A1Y1XX15_9FUNG|nr:hypothetical protein K493DRAFT_305276 [Basidiobolus meristosporus CBS 931.73]|eukprot:ORX90036.1 hypothetical protein K493DRAFT_305276 [Basidiobolus meristosporus CBS 931.73]
MPVVETVGGFIGVAIVSSVVARRIREKRHKEKVNNLIQDLWIRRNFTYGSPEVIPGDLPNGSFTTQMYDSQVLSRINYHPGISVSVVPDIIAPPIHLHHENLFTSHSSNIPIASLPTLSGYSTGHSSREFDENIELSLRNLPTPPSCIVRREIPSAPIIDATADRVCLEAPMVTAAQQVPSAPELGDIELCSATPRSDNSIPSARTQHNISDAGVDCRVDSEVESDEDRSSMESFYSCSSTLEE